MVNNIPNSNGKEIFSQYVFNAVTKTKKGDFSALVFPTLLETVSVDFCFFLFFVILRNGRRGNR